MTIFLEQSVALLEFEKYIYFMKFFNMAWQPFKDSSVNEKLTNIFNEIFDHDIFFRAASGLA